MLWYHKKFDILGEQHGELVLIDGVSVFMVLTNDWVKVGEL